MEQQKMEMLTCEVRAGGVHIEGYVNAVMRESRPVITPRGKVNEIVEEKVFQRAIDNAKNVDILVDHRADRKVGSTTQGNLQLYEDAIGLRAVTDITDPYIVEKAKLNQIKGWSFGFTNAEDSLEMRAGKLPLRHLKGFDIKEVTLVCEMTPCYSATSVEVRAGNEEVIEQRSFFDGIDEMIPQEIIQNNDGIKEPTNNEGETTVKPDENTPTIKIVDPNNPQTVENKPLEEQPKDTQYQDYLIRVVKLKKRG